ncbi:MAG: SDR family NAD(P)-dependent oxidoreductase [Cyclobacteriaceae bacterium]|nr:SDR family NAD(P)-dependent oxidoreductase [Cyclobacteriaceae bacterium]
MDNTKKFALVTGASLGIGRAMAIELSKRNINTLLIALDTPELHQTRQFIASNYATRVDAFGTDLTMPEAAGKIFEWCRQNNYEVDILINNAGFGESGFFENNPMERYSSMIELNMKAYVAMIHSFLPDMKKNGYGHIMNTSSMEAFLPSPYKSVYCATKNFVYAFSLSLSQEVKRFGIKLSILCPGSVITNKGGLARIKAQGKKAELLIMMPDEVAEIAIRNMLKGMLIIIPGRTNWWLSKIAKVIPSRIKVRIMERIYRAYA